MRCLRRPMIVNPFTTINSLNSCAAFANSPDLTGSTTIFQAHLGLGKFENVSGEKA
jgi:hypothetical protein